MPAAPSERLRFETDGALAFVTFNRPEARNAMSWDMYDALVAACDRVDADPAIRVFILRGAGGTFVSGTDIAQFTDFTRFTGSSEHPGIAYERHLDEVVDRLERVRCPTIAQVQGVAAGGGCALALACDIRLCTPDARFGVPIARTLGNCLSAANYARLLDLIGPARLKDLMFTGRLIDAPEAATLGLVYRIVAAGEIDAAVRADAQTIASNAPLTLRATKEMIRRIQAHRRLPAEQAHDLITLCYTSEDFKEGVDAFVGKRKPVWKGK